MAHDKSRFRVTTWPSQPLPHPRPLLNAPMAVRDGLIVGTGIDAKLIGEIDDALSREEQLELFVRAGMHPPSDRYEEIYLQLFLLDIGDDEAIAEWVTEFDVFRPHVRSRPHLPDATFDHPYPQLAYYPMFDRTDELDEHGWFADEVARSAEVARAAAGQEDEPDRLWAPTVEEFRWVVRCLRDLARTYWCLATDANPSEVRWENPLIARSFEEPTVESWWDEWEMRWFLSRTLQEGLAGFSPRLIDEEVLSKRGKERTIMLSEQFASSLDLFAVCCLELFNHIAEGALYRTCGNERCARWFVRQQGRAVHDQHRTSGVKFCSYRCARAQTQREYNRRRRSARVRPLR